MKANVGDGVVHPMDHDARNDASGAGIHPTQENAEQESVRHLRRVYVNDSKQYGRDKDGNPETLLLSSPLHQCTQHGSAENHLLNDGSENADGEIPPGRTQNGSKLVFHDVGQRRHLFLQPERRNDGAHGGNGRPEDDSPGTRAQIVGGDFTPSCLQEDDEQNHAICRRGSYQHRNGGDRLAR